MKRAPQTDDKKEYLLSYRKAMDRERRICTEIERLQKDKLIPDAAGIKLLPVEAFCDDPDYRRILNQEVTKLKQERIEKIKLYRNIEARIRNMDSENEREILRLRYLTGMSWDGGAEEMNYSCQHVHRIHTLALKHF